MRLTLLVMSYHSHPDKKKKLFPFFTIFAKLMSRRDIYFHFQHAFGIRRASEREGEKLLFIVSTVWSANKLIKWFGK